MNSFVPSDTELFPACVAILDEKRMPLRYDHLTTLAIERLGYRNGKVNLFRAKEDVRERLPVKSSTDIFYTSKPLCLMARRHWFRNMQLPLMNIDYVEIPGSATDGYLGAFEALMRAPHMIDKWNGDIERRNRKRSSGLVLEQHVSNWFKSKWPEFYLEPENYHAWQQPCSHDFRLHIGGKTILIDVAGYGEYGYRNPGKSTTDLHLYCRINGANVIWEGVEHGKRYDSQVVPETAISPMNMIVWLNCHKHGINYDGVRAAIEA